MAVYPAEGISKLKYDVGLKPAQWQLPMRIAAKEANVKKMAQQTRICGVPF